MLHRAIAAPADDPVDLGGAYVLDRSGVLGGDTTAVREAIDRLFEERGIQLFVVYVDEFTGTSSDQDWANETAISSGLGDRDILLAIATDERIYSVSVADAFPLTDDQLADVATRLAHPRLARRRLGGRRRSPMPTASRTRWRPPPCRSSSAACWSPASAPS